MGKDNLIHLFTFIQMIYGGLAVGLCYDIVDFIFYEVTKKRHLSDAVFWICTLMISATVFFYAADFTLRLYLLTGLILGWAIYFLLISPLIQFIFDIISTLIEKTAKILFKPFQTVYKIGAKKFAHQIIFIKRGAKTIINLPKSTKKIYNKYSKYFMGRRRNDDDQSRRKETQD